jgi:hypothetical protein
METKRNEPKLQREVNDRIYEVLREWGGEDGDFYCECGRPECDELIQVTLREYAARGKALLAPEHRLPAG